VVALESAKVLQYKALAAKITKLKENIFVKKSGVLVTIPSFNKGEKIEKINAWAF